LRRASHAQASRVEEAALVQRVWAMQQALRVLPASLPAQASPVSCPSARSRQAPEAQAARARPT
jgi:hypothetical protein